MCEVAVMVHSTHWGYSMRVPTALINTSVYEKPSAYLDVWLAVQEMQATNTTE